MNDRHCGAFWTVLGITTVFAATIGIVTSWIIHWLLRGVH